MAMDIIAYTLRERATPASRRENRYCVPRTRDLGGIYLSAWFHGLIEAGLGNFIFQDLDILVICPPLTKETRNMFAKEQVQITALHESN
jgi:lactate dehydrogenase-like 2-hydroxyacid dehydrogenase